MAEQHADQRLGRRLRHRTARTGRRDDWRRRQSLAGALAVR
jgi:hypothetical protein